MSSISAVSGLSSLYGSAQTENSQANNSFSAFEQLATALQSNNLSAAQQAYNTLATQMQNSPSGQSNSPAATAFNALGQALQSGNLQAAQQAFSNLEQDAVQAMMQGIGGHHHHHHGGGGGGGGLLQSTATSSSENVSDSLFNNSSSTTSSSNVTSDSSTNSQTNNPNNLLNVLI